MSYEAQLENMGYPVPELPVVSARPFEPGIKTGNLIFVSGNAARVGGELKYTGIVGKDVTLQEAQDAARICLQASQRLWMRYQSLPGRSLVRQESTAGWLWEPLPFRGIRRWK